MARRSQTRYSFPAAVFLSGRERDVGRLFLTRHFWPSDRSPCVSADCSLQETEKYSRRLSFDALLSVLARSGNNLCCLPKNPRQKETQ